jgi:hypothetical protein
MPGPEKLREDWEAGMTGYIGIRGNGQNGDAQ